MSTPRFVGTRPGVVGATHAHVMPRLSPRMIEPARSARSAGIGCKDPASALSSSADDLTSGGPMRVASGTRRDEEGLFVGHQVLAPRSSRWMPEIAAIFEIMGAAERLTFTSARGAHTREGAITRASLAIGRVAKR